MNTGDSRLKCGKMHEKNKWGIFRLAFAFMAVRIASVKHHSFNVCPTGDRPRNRLDSAHVAAAVALHRVHAGVGGADDGVDRGPVLGRG